MENIDMLRDGPYVEQEKDLTQWLQGSRNQRYVDCKRTLEEGHYIEYEFHLDD